MSKFLFDFFEEKIKNCKNKKALILFDLILINFKLNDFNVEKLAELSRLSRVYIHNIITENFEIKPIDFINNCRLCFAIELLKEGNIKTYNVAKKSGFGSPRTMTNVMKRRLNKNPGQLKEMIKSTIDNSILESLQQQVWS